MDTYRIEWKKSALKEIKLIDRSVIPRILDSIDSLKYNPRPNGVRKLKGTQQTYRIRVGNYRIVYEIEDDVLRILIIRVKHRQTAYELY